jgi:hypothetical protein
MVVVSRARFSGGLIEEMVDSLPYVVGSTTCTQKGFGFDNPATHSGAWTDMFLTQGLGQLTTTEVDLVQLFQNSRAKYTKIYHSRGDWPCFFGRDDYGTFNTNDHPDDNLPQGRFLCNDWLAAK